jgi:acetyl esterase/lipase
MTSLKSKIVIFTIQNRNLFKGSLKREVITPETDTAALRRQYEESALKFGSLPEGVEVTPVHIPGLPAGAKAEWIHLAGMSTSPSQEDKAIFYTHGGGYVTGNCVDHRVHVAKFVKACGVGAFLYDYRLAPENPFPAGMDDTMTAYRWLLEKGVKSENILIAGESAGGGLCLASLIAIRDSHLPLPCAGVALSPWTDLKCTGKSYKTNARKDVSTLGSWTIWNGYYIGQNDPENPWISPLYADMHGLPPIMIQVGDHEILLDDSVRFAEKASAAGVEMTLHVWKGMVHCFPMLAPMFPEATQAWEETAAYIREKMKINSNDVGPVE